MGLRIVYGGLVIVLTVFYGIAPTIIDKSVMTSLLILVLLCLILFFFRKEPCVSLRGQYIKHSTLALLGIIIVFFQYPLDYILGNFGDSPDMYFWVNSNIVIKSLTLSVIGFLCFLIGFLSFRFRGKRKKPKEETPANVDFLVFLAAIMLVIYFMNLNPLYLAGHYGMVEIGLLARAAASGFQVLVFAAIIQKCRNMILMDKRPRDFIRYIKQFGWPLIIIVAIYLMSVLVSGDRGPLIYYSLLLFGGYFFVTKRRIRLIYIVVMVIAAASAITFLAQVRNKNLKNYTFLERVAYAVDIENIKREQSILPQTAELSWSVKSLNTAVSYVPERHDYFYGRFQFQLLAQVIPFASLYFPLLFDEYSRSTEGSSTFITWIRQGSNAEQGNGSSCMADLYLDFGVPGVIIGMFLFGYLIRYSELAMYKDELPSLFEQILFMVYLSIALYIARSVILMPIRNIVWIYCILIINKHLIHWFGLGRRYHANLR